MSRTSFANPPRQAAVPPRQPAEAPCHGCGQPTRQTHLWRVYRGVGKHRDLCDACHDVWIDEQAWVSEPQGTAARPEANNQPERSCIMAEPLRPYEWGG